MEYSWKSQIWQIHHLKLPLLVVGFPPKLFTGGFGWLTPPIPVVGFTIEGPPDEDFEIEAKVLQNIDDLGKNLRNHSNDNNEENTSSAQDSSSERIKELDEEINQYIDNDPDYEGVSEEEPEQRGADYSNSIEGESVSENKISSRVKRMGS